MPALTTELETSFRPAGTEITPVEGSTVADALKLGGNVVNKLRTDYITQGVEMDLTSLRSSVIESEGMKEEATEDLLNLSRARAASTVQGMELELGKISNATKTGVMSQTLFIAKAHQIMKKYAAMAPGLTPEISQIGRRILGSDPTLDLLNMAFADRGESPEQKAFNERYSLLQQVATENGSFIPGKDAVDRGEVEDLLFVEMGKKRERVQLDLATKYQGYDAKEHTRNAKEYVPIKTQDTFSRIAQVYQESLSIENPNNRADFLEQNLSALKTEVMSDVSNRYRLATGLDDTYKPLLDYIDREINRSQGKNAADFAENRLNLHRDRVHYETLSAYNNAGFTLEAIVNMDPSGTVTSSNVNALSQLLVGIIDPRKIALTPAQRRFFGLGPGESLAQPSAVIPQSGGSVQPQSGVNPNEIARKNAQQLKPLIESIRAKIPKENEAQFKQAITEGLLQPLIQSYQTTNADDAELMNTRTAALLSVAQNANLDTLTPQQFGAVSLALEDAIQGSQKFINQEVVTGRANTVEVENDKFVIKPNTSKSLWQAMTTDRSSRLMQYRRMGEELNTLYTVYTDVYGDQSKEDFLRYMETGQIDIASDEVPYVGSLEEKADAAIEAGVNPNDVVNATDDQAGLTNKEMEVEPAGQLTPQAKTLIENGYNLKEVQEFLESKNLKMFQDE
jgi:hypothetical protein